VSTGTFWLAIALISVGTQALRLTPMLAHGRVRTPPVVRRLLAHLPAAALTALAVPGTLYAQPDSFELTPLKIVAGVVALLVALRTRSIIWTLAAGMLALWGLQALV
jgi:branched-subunit amino acid transport protein